MRYKYLCTFLLLSVFSVAYAQEYKKFKTVLGLGRNLIRANSGLLYIEPSYLVKDNLSIGFGFELMTTIVDITSVSKTQGSLTSSDLMSYSLNAQYYLSNAKKLRPYIGFGAGIWAMYVDNGTYVTNGRTTARKSGSFLYYASKPGCYSRIGFDWWHFNVAAEYNLVPSSQIEVVTSSSTQSMKIKNSVNFLFTPLLYHPVVSFSNA